MGFSDKIETNCASQATEFKVSVHFPDPGPVVFVTNHLSENILQVMETEVKWLLERPGKAERAES